MKLIIRILMLVSLTGLLAQKWQKTATGLKYKIIKDVAGTNAAVGNYVTIHFQFRNFKDSLINSSIGRDPLELKVQKTFKGSLEEGFTMMSAGDSMIFEVPSDSLGFPNRPPFIPVGSMVYFRVKMLNVMTEAQYQAAMLKRIEEQKAKEDLQIKNYIQSKGYTARKLPSGMYIVTTQPGTGVNPTVGQNVQVHYTGLLLNGQKFDSSVDRGSPFSFPLGQGRVIKGWDEGIADLKIGEKAVLLIPSYMGYGMQGSPPTIPGNSILIFEVELLNAN